MRRVDIIKRAGKNIRLAKGRTILTRLHSQLQLERVVMLMLKV